MNSLGFSKVTGYPYQIHTRTVSFAKSKPPVDFNVEIKYRYTPKKCEEDVTNSLDLKSISNND